MIEQFTNMTSPQNGDGRATPAQAASQAMGGMFSNPGGLAAAGAAGGLAGLFLGGGKPKKLAKNAVKIGGVALVGGLAYKAWRDWQSKNAAPGANAPARHTDETMFVPENHDEQARLARVLAQAMITATKADGRVTTEEKMRIIDQLTTLGVSDNDLGFIRTEIEKPFDMESIVREATSPELAAEIYTASLLAIDADGAAERGYLSMLATRLALAPSLVEQIHANVVEPDGKAAA